MEIRTIVINEIEKADAIASRDRTFDVAAEDFGVAVGDFIHYIVVCNGVHIKHAVDRKIYVVTYVTHMHNLELIISIKPAVEWLNRARYILKSAFYNGWMTQVRFYGKDHIEQSKIKYYDDSSIIMSDSSNMDIHRNIEDIVDITLFKDSGK